MPELTAIEIAVVEQLADTFPHLVAIYLHDSAAKGRLHATSDIDIALLFSGKDIPERIELFLLAPVLEQRVGRKVDLSILSTSNTVFAKEVLVNGKLLYCTNTMLHDQFAMYVFSFYGKLNDERAEILRAYQAQ
ncbi:MAG: nucleotidyltransferase domain-containing protein [Desulfobulbaceae bacterium]|nr:nucleotidyltransferase domain-containing protein [Desulfobulbaceae bacterium]